MSAKRKDVFSEVIVGIFMLAVMALLVYFTIVISDVDFLFGRQRVEATVSFQDVGGLKEHDNVMYRGMKVGTVESVRLTDEDIRVTVRIEPNVILREGYRISVGDLSMLGGHYLLFEEGERDGNVLPLGETVFKGETPADFGRSLANAAGRLDELLSDERLPRILEEVETATSNIAVIATNLREGRGTVGMLLSENATVYQGLESTLTNLAAVTTLVREGRGTVGRLFTDEKIYTDLTRALDGAASVAEGLKRGEGLAGRLLAKDDPIAVEFHESVKAFRQACSSMDVSDTVASANRLLESLNVVAERLSKGEGTVGRLMADDHLYNEIEGLTKDVRQVLDNFRDTTPISTFGSLIMGGL